MDEHVEEVKPDEWDEDYFDPEEDDYEDISEDEGHELEESVGDLPEGDGDVQPA